MHLPENILSHGLKFFIALRFPIGSYGNKIGIMLYTKTF